MRSSPQGWRAPQPSWRILSCRSARSTPDTGVIQTSPLRSSAPERSRRSLSRNAIVAPPAWFRRTGRWDSQDRASTRPSSRGGAGRGTGRSRRGDSGRLRKCRVRERSVARLCPGLGPRRACRRFPACRANCAQLAADPAAASSSDPGYQARRLAGYRRGRASSRREYRPTSRRVGIRPATRCRIRNRTGQSGRVVRER